MHGDFILGNNLIDNYLPMHIYPKSIGLTLEKELVDISLIPKHQYECEKGLAPTKRGDNALTPMFTLDELINPK